MGKALYPFLILNLLLAGAAAGFGVTLYNQRQVVKARTLLLEQSVKQMTGNLKYETAADLAGALNVSEPGQLANMKSRLAEFSKHSQAVQMDLDSTRETLAVTRETLAETQTELADTESKLEMTEQKLADTEESLDEAKTEIVATKRTLQLKENEIETLGETIATLNTQIQDRDEEIETLEIDKERITAERDTLAEQLASARNPGSGSGDGSPETNWKGREALVLEVNQDWNYAIIDKGSIDNLEMYLEPLIHRDDSYVGKLRVTRIEENVAICDILPETFAEGAAVEQNDRIFF